MRQMAFELPVIAAMGREDYVLSASNREAALWIDRWPDWPSYSLSIWGPPGAGKTHLGHIWRTRTEAVAWTGAAPLPPERHLLMDFSASPQWDKEGEIAMLHGLNLIASEQRSLLILTPTPPARWNIQLADLSSRLAAMPAIEMFPPDDTLLAALLVKHFRDRRLVASSEVIAYLLSRIDRSFAAAHDIAEGIDRILWEKKHPLTIASVREALRRMEPRE
ncbi:MAG TPA: DNA replication protein [Dongiaceae bacterium]|jgi:chromosomal replication initiation ATPase DnaA|nr:DNA replication protein [Dongiaceae bacterium]